MWDFQTTNILKPSLPAGIEKKLIWNWFTNKMSADESFPVRVKTMIDKYKLYGMRRSQLIKYSGTIWDEEVVLIGLKTI